MVRRAILYKLYWNFEKLQKGSDFIQKLNSYIIMKWMNSSWRVSIIFYIISMDCNCICTYGENHIALINYEKDVLLHYIMIVTKCLFKAQ